MANDLVWLHLSDIHFRPKTSWRDVAARKALLDFLRQEFQQGTLPNPDLIFCTGDIAFGEASKAPMPQQYAHAKEFFCELLKCCGNLSSERLFVVPGNHDVSRTAINEDAQAALVQKANTAREHESAINQRFEEADLTHQQAFERLDDYKDFVAAFLPHQASPSRHVYARLLEVNGKKIAIAGMNSAWSCAGPEDDRHLWLAAQWQFNHVKKILDQSHIRIGLIHHPTDWLNEPERDLANRRINSDFHFWLHGHSHNAWVDPGQTSIKIAAGAVGAEHPEEFGINLVNVDFATRSGKVHLFSYASRDNGWVMHAIPHQAPTGIWHLQVPPLAEPASLPEPENTPLPPSTEIVQAPQPSTPVSVSNPISLPETRQIKLYGRDAMLGRLNKQLQQKQVLVLYGMRGNGKSALIRRLAQQAPLAGRELLRIPAAIDYGTGYLFRQLAPLLRDNTEQPRAPEGDLESMVTQLRERYQDAQPACIWIDMAHLWFDTRGWQNSELGKLFAACQLAFADRWYWIYELRERPLAGVLGRNSHEEEIPGLDKASLSECLREAAPSGREAEWSYAGDKLRQLYQWLGGGQGEQAHPQAIQLLIEVARGLDINPLEVRQRFLSAVEEKVEDYLLRDLYESVLSPPEQTLLQALALYRDAIPHDHADLLEERLGVENAWSGLDRRCLLPSDADQTHYYLHGFIAGWLRNRLGYLVCDNKTADFGLLPEITAEQAAKLAQFHAHIADCWLSQLGQRSRLTQPNISRALEAFHHLLCSGESHRIQEIAAQLLGGHAQWASKQLWSYDEKLREDGKPISSQRQILDFITQLDPEDHKAWRFLGECWQKEEEDCSPKAIHAFETALKLNPDFPPYLANLGKALLAQGKPGAQIFLRRLAQHREEFPNAINNFITSIEADCMQMVGEESQASILRVKHIAANTRDPAFYAAEAEYKLNSGNLEEALHYVELALQRGGANGYTESIHAKVLEAQGDNMGASALRRKYIDAGDRNPAFYSAEAEYQLSCGNIKSAFHYIDLARQRGCANPYTESILAKVQEAQGDGLKQR